MMDPEFLINGVMGSVFGGRRKTSRKAMKYLRRGSTSVMNHPGAWLTAAGVAWGIYETLQNPGPQTYGGQGLGGSAATGAGPGGTAAAPMPPLPPLPKVAPAAPMDATQRVVSLAVSAATADGVMTDSERAAVLEEAKKVGVGDVVQAELTGARPLAQIVAGVTEPAERAALYVLAFTILRADEQVTGAERIYLAQLANLLGLDPATVTRLEQDTAARIDAQ